MCLLKCRLYFLNQNSQLDSQLMGLTMEELKVNEWIWTYVSNWTSISDYPPHRKLPSIQKTNFAQPKFTQISKVQSGVPSWLTTKLHSVWSCPTPNTSLLKMMANWRIKKERKKKKRARRMMAQKPCATLFLCTEILSAINSSTHTQVSSKIVRSV